ncbi:M1 family aminopeptidase [Hymenobacter bucti]|uniref:M1 family aminopeptidase n=1 Tax=Hymenobacter bucti TaxID=1844114 RepID=A0ABW4QSZ3_9BACT
MKFLVMLLGLVLGSVLTGYAVPRVRVQLAFEPATRAFTCRYTFALPAGDTTSVLRLNLNKNFRVQRVQSGWGVAQMRRLYYPFFADTMQQVVVRYPAGRRARTLTLVYAGILGQERTTAQVLEFSGHSNWLPFRPLSEFEVVEYTLAVRVPAGYQVRSTRPPRRTRPGSYEFEGQASAIELTAIIAPQFQQVVARTGAAVSVVKAGAALGPTEAAILPKAQDIVAFYNRTIGRQDSISRFTVLLTGTQQDAFGLLDNATVITYVSPDFDLSQREDLLILAHEISHKWWGYGSVHDESDWLNEAFATYSSMLYLQAKGDTAGYRQNYTKLAKTTANTPPIIGFDRMKYEPGMYRRVIYNKGMTVLAALHTRVGTAQLYSILARTAAQRVGTTQAFLDVVGQVAGPDSRAWLLARLSE